MDKQTWYSPADCDSAIKRNEVLILWLQPELPLKTFRCVKDARDKSSHTLCDSIYTKCPEYVNPQTHKADLELPAAGKLGDGSYCSAGVGFPLR